MMAKRPPRVDITQIGSKKMEFQLELRIRFETLQERDDIDIMSEPITHMIQQSASRVAKAINKPHKSRVSSPTQALMTKRREMAGNGDNKQRIEYSSNRILIVIQYGDCVSRSLNDTSIIKRLHAGFR